MNETSNNERFEENSICHIPHNNNSIWFASIYLLRTNYYKIVSSSKTKCVGLLSFESKSFCLNLKRFDDERYSNLKCKRGGVVKAPCFYLFLYFDNPSLHNKGSTLYQNIKFAPNFIFLAPL